MRTFISALLLSSVAFVGPTSAKGYTTFYGGMNWNDVIEAPKVDEETGTLVGMSVGKTVDSFPNFRVELDASYRTNDVNLGLINVNHDTTALMGNVVYDFPNMFAGGVPYVLGGVGVAYTEMTFENVSLLKVENTDLAWQFGTGIDWTVAEGVKAGVGYRYFSGPELNVLGTEISDGTNNSAVVSVTFSM